MFRKDLSQDKKIPGVPPIIAPREGTAAQMAADVLVGEVTASNPRVRRNNNVAYYQLIIADPTQAIENTPVD